ncbi:MAG: hypothetical protein KGJ62_06485 [Armatimonadetes bacterium]|nr:hypothetical protein [Armatimonadota bacterium]MDE2207275.1 hypothetical protein [Armatimonadota bacterium]
MTDCLEPDRIAARAALLLCRMPNDSDTEATPIAALSHSTADHGATLQSGPGADAGLAALAALAYVVFYTVTGVIPNGSISVVAASTFLSLLLALMFAAWAGRALMERRILWLSLPATLLLALPVVAVPLLLFRFPHWSSWPALVADTRWYWLAVAMVPGLRGLLQIWLAAAVGAAVSRLVGEVKLLLPMAVVLAAVDLYAVFGGGVVAQAVHKKSGAAVHAMQTLTVQLPSTHGAMHGAHPIALTVGFADFLFIALFFACFKRFHIPARRTFWIMYVVLALYSALVYLTGIALPALVPIALVVIICHSREFRYERQEKIALCAATLVAAAVGLAFWLAGR